MGFCRDFATTIGGGGCAEAMVVRDGSSCVCPGCGVVCEGRFSGCETVWGRRPADVGDDHDREREFFALPLVELNSARVESEGPVPARTGVADADAALALERTEELRRSLDAMTRALMAQTSLNSTLMITLERLEATLRVFAARLEVIELGTRPPIGAPDYGAC